MNRIEVNKMTKRGDWNRLLLYYTEKARQRMNSLQKRALAQLAYEEISAVIQKWERLGNYGYLPFSCNWDGCITVDDELFHEWQLRKSEE